MISRKSKTWTSNAARNIKDGSSQRKQVNIGQLFRHRYLMFSSWMAGAQKLVIKELSASIYFSLLNYTICMNVVQLEEGAHFAYVNNKLDLRSGMLPSLLFRKLEPIQQDSNPAPSKSGIQNPAGEAWICQSAVRYGSRYTTICGPWINSLIYATRPPPLQT